MVNVFSFCLYGPENVKYYRGLLENIFLAGKYFPDWKVYVYVAPDVEESMINHLKACSSVELRYTNELGPSNMIHRFYAIDESGVDLMMVRDADSRIHWKDRWAINDFLSKPQYLAHIIRDNRQHDARILAGLWGIHKSSGISVKDLFQEYLKYPIDLGYGISGMDQSFLGSYIYPRIKSNLLAHTSNNQQRSGESNVTFPFVYTDQIHCGKVDGPEFVDENIGVVRDVGRRILVNGRFKL